VRGRTKLVIGVSGLLLISAAAAFFFLRYQVTKSFPHEVGSITLSGLSAPVEVFRDEFGVPHLVARNDHDLYMATGFVHAQDRMWQMDIARRAGQGRLAEVLGQEALPFDRMFRTLGLKRLSDEIGGSLSAESRESLRWYADGVNAYLELHRGKYPLEFDLLGYDPDPWLPVHTILLSRLLAWQLNLSWWTDLTLGEIAERVGLPRALDVFPSYPADVAPTVSGAPWRWAVLLGAGYRETAQAYSATFGPATFLGGSNAWVLGPSRSVTGAALLANDTHLPLFLPSLWYELQLRTPGHMVRGMSIPGMPGVVAGRNDSIAWGVTNLMADEADFYVERLDAGGRMYRFEGEWIPLEVRTEQIDVRGDTSVPVTVRATHHGPVISDVGPVLRKSRYPYAVSVRWVGFEADDQFAAYRAINKARNWKEFSEGVRQFTVPAQNFVYCDVRGNIGYRSGVRIPLRGKQSSLLPLPGWEADAEWKGYVPFEEQPFLYNPPEGYIASANNRVVDDAYPHHITDLWEPPSRIVRLREILGKEGELFSVGDCERLQNDTFSFHAMEIVPFLFHALRDTSLDLPEAARVAEYLRNWNFHFAEDDIATTIFQQFFVSILENIYRDEMGDSLYHDYLVLANVPIRVTTRLLKEGTSMWFDDVRTETIETRDDILLRSLRESVVALRDRLGSQMKTWRWGEIHTVTLQHPLGLVKPLDTIFNLGPYPFPGGATALVSGEFRYGDPFAVLIGPSYRQIFDMSAARDTRVILPSGQCGQVYHKHYDDQTSLWLMGGYRIGRLEERKDAWSRLLLEPG
jgi:penicillin amidase